MNFDFIILELRINLDMYYENRRKHNYPKEISIQLNLSDS